VTGCIWWSSQSFKKKNRVGVLASYLGNDIFPGPFRDHVSGIASESVHTPAAPELKNISHVLPQIRVSVVQLGQVRPYNTPGTGHADFAVILPVQPFGMGFMKPGCPARMVDGNVKDYIAVVIMHGIYQLYELFKGGGGRVKLGLGRVHIRKVQGGIGTSKPAHPGIGGGRGVNGHKVKRPAAHSGKDKV